MRGSLRRLWGSLKSNALAFAKCSTLPMMLRTSTINSKKGLCLRTEVDAVTRGWAWAADIRLQLPREHSNHDTLSRQGGRECGTVFLKLLR